MSEAKTVNSTRDDMHGILCKITIAGETARAIARLDGLIDASGREDWAMVRNFALHAIGADLEAQADVADRLWLASAPAREARA
jgi:hypothetical protein